MSQMTTMIKTTTLLKPHYQWRGDLTNYHEKVANLVELFEINTEEEEKISLFFKIIPESFKITLQQKLRASEENFARAYARNLHAEFNDSCETEQHDHVLNSPWRDFSVAVTKPYAPPTFNDVVKTVFLKAVGGQLKARDILAKTLTKTKFSATNMDLSQLILHCFNFEKKLKIVRDYDTEGDERAERDYLKSFLETLPAIINSKMNNPLNYQDAKEQAHEIVTTLELLPKEQQFFHENSVSVLTQSAEPQKFTYAPNADVETKSIALKLNRAQTNRAVIAAIASVIERELEPISPETEETRKLIDDIRNIVAEATNGKECITAMTHLMPTKFLQRKLTEQTTEYNTEGANLSSLKKSRSKRKFVNGLTNSRDGEDVESSASEEDDSATESQKPQKNQPRSTRKRSRSNRSEELSVIANATAQAVVNHLNSSRNKGFSSRYEPNRSFSPSSRYETRNKNSRNFRTPYRNCSACNGDHHHSVCPDLIKNGKRILFCSYCKTRNAHTNENCPVLAKRQCFHCQGWGHSAKWCDQKKAKNG
jgi:hypothetical protein